MKTLYVDGYKIRQNLDPDFNIMHYNNPKTGSFESKLYIPKDEIWLDKRFINEEDFLKRTISSKIKSKKVNKKPDDFIIKEKKRGSLKIQHVNGEIVRKYIDDQFVMGGHDLIYSYIPEKTIWIEDKLDPRDIPHIILHEITERKLMARGKSYDNAHDYATAVEKESRRNAGGKYFGDYGRLKFFRKNIKLC